MTTTPPEPEASLPDLAGLSPGQAAVRLRGAAEPIAAMMSLCDEADQLLIRDLGAAMRRTQWLVETADALASGRARVRARRSRIQALAYANRFEDALTVCREATEIAAEAGEPVEGARAQLAGVHALARLGRFDEAIAAGEAARLALVAADAPALAARADLNLGVLHRMRDDPQRALVHFTRALAPLRDEPVILAQLESNRAEALLDLNDFGHAEEAFAAALAAFEQAGMTRAAAIVEGNLADLMSRQGRLDRALAYFEQARRRLGDSEAPGDVARLQAERAEALAAAGLHLEAAETLREILPTLQSLGMAWETARSAAAMGSSLLRLGRDAEAEEALAAAAAGFEDLKHATGAARVNLLRAEIKARAGDLAGALDLAEAQLPKLTDRPADLAVGQLQYAGLALAAGDLAKAEAALNAAASAASVLDAAPFRADLRHLRARLHRRRERLDEAAADYRAAIEQVERIRGSLQADRLRSAFLGEHAGLFSECFTTELDRDAADSIPRAFATAEAARSRALLDLLHGGAELVEPAGTDSAGPQQALLAELDRRHAELNALYATLDRALVSRQPQRDPDLWAQAVRACESRMTELQTRLAATASFSGIFAPAVTIEQARALLRPGTILLQYFLEDAHVSLITLSASGQAHAFRRICAVKQVRAALDRLRFQIARHVARTAANAPAAPAAAADATRALAALHTLLVAPAHNIVAKAQRLCILPHGLLHAVPFHALHDGQAYLLERAEITTAPSASVLAHLRRRRPASSGPPLIIGIADAAAPLAEQEATTVAATLAEDHPTLLLGAAATRDAVLRHARPPAAEAAPGLIHIATHARFSSDDPLTSGIRLADGWLTVRDLMRLRLNGAVVTLSACEAGRASVAAGDELLGLVRGVLVGGARAVLTTLWPVHDQVAAALMAAVYTRWYSVSSEMEAGLAGPIREAQIELMHQRPHPASWAPFTLVGA